ncbi:hypothetical protein [Spirillospora sp. NPDC048824]|uniref:hypothetical protein n=1 Tax=Spirillospora sp. NPDC048824 TaxID=3364526 RepID=UPI0037151B2B
MQTDLIIAVFALSNGLADGLGVVFGDCAQGGDDAAVAEGPLFRLFPRGLTIEEWCTGAVATLKWSAVTVGNVLWILRGVLEVRAVDSLREFLGLIAPLQPGGDPFEAICHAALEGFLVQVGHAGLVIGQSLARDPSLPVV